MLKEAIQESSIGIKAKEDSPFDAVQCKQCQQYEVLYVGKIKVRNALFLSVDKTRFSFYKKSRLYTFKTI